MPEEEYEQSGCTKRLGIVRNKIWRMLIDGLHKFSSVALGNESSRPGGRRQPRFRGNNGGRDTLCAVPHPDRAQRGAPLPAIGNPGAGLSTLPRDNGPSWRAIHRRVGNALPLR